IKITVLILNHGRNWNPHHLPLLHENQALSALSVLHLRMADLLLTMYESEGSSSNLRPFGLRLLRSTGDPVSSEVGSSLCWSVDDEEAEEDEEGAEAEE